VAENSRSSGGRLDLSQDVQEAFEQWMVDQRFEDLKLIRFQVVSAVLIQAIMRLEKQAPNCNIPID